MYDLQVCRLQVPLYFRESAKSAAWADRPAKSSGRASRNPRDSLRLALWGGCIAALQVTLLLHVRALGVAAETGVGTLHCLLARAIAAI